MVKQGTTVEESVLDVEGVGPGVSAWWVQAHATELTGRRAVWRVLLATAASSRTAVQVYEAKVPGPSFQHSFRTFLYIKNHRNQGQTLHFLIKNNS